MGTIIISNNETNNQKKSTQTREEKRTLSIRRARVSLLTANRILRNLQAHLFYFFLPATVSECVIVFFSYTAVILSHRLSFSANFQ